MRGRRGTRNSSTTRRSGDRKSNSRRAPGSKSSSPQPSRSQDSRPQTRLTPGVSEPEYAESIGNTLEDAIEKALNVLGARDDEVDVEILEEGKRGFLGFGIRRPFRVRLSWREDTTQEIVVDKEEASPAPPPSRPVRARNPLVNHQIGRAGETQGVIAPAQTEIVQRPGKGHNLFHWKDLTQLPKSRPENCSN